MNYCFLMRYQTNRHSTNCYKYRRDKYRSNTQQIAIILDCLKRYYDSVVFVNHAWLYDFVPNDKIYLPNGLSRISNLPSSIRDKFFACLAPNTIY